MRQQRTETQWREIFEDYERSCLSQERYCKREGLCRASFANWRRKLRANLAPISAGFVELCVSNPQPMTADNKEQDSDLVVELPYGVVLRFRGIKQ